MDFWLETFGTLDAAGNRILTSGNNALVTSILSAGSVQASSCEIKSRLTGFLFSTFVGALCAYPVGDYFGRRLGIMLFLILFCVGVALQVSPPTRLILTLLTRARRLEVKTLPLSSLDVCLRDWE